MGRAAMRKLQKMNKEFSKLTKLGKQYDKETDPQKKKALKKLIEERCNVFKATFETDRAAIVAEVAAETDVVEGNPGQELMDSDS